MIQTYFNSQKVFINYKSFIPCVANIMHKDLKTYFINFKRLKKLIQN